MKDSGAWCGWVSSYLSQTLPKRTHKRWDGDVGGWAHTGGGCTVNIVALVIDGRQPQGEKEMCIAVDVFGSRWFGEVRKGLHGESEDRPQAGIVTSID